MEYSVDGNILLYWGTGVVISLLEDSSHKYIAIGVMSLIAIVWLLLVGWC